MPPPPTWWNLRWGLCFMGECTPKKWCSPDLCHTHVCPSLKYRQNLLSWLKTVERHSTLQSTLSRHQSSWGVSSSLARSTRDQSPTASRRFPVVIDDTAGATYAQISSLDAVRVATAACTMHWLWHASVLRVHPEPGLWVCECSTDHC